MRIDESRVLGEPGGAGHGLAVQRAFLRVPETVLVRLQVVDEQIGAGVLDRAAKHQREDVVVTDRQRAHIARLHAGQLAHVHQVGRRVGGEVELHEDASPRVLAKAEVRVVAAESDLVADSRQKRQTGDPADRHRLRVEAEGDVAGAVGQRAEQRRFGVPGITKGGGGRDYGSSLNGRFVARPHNRTPKCRIVEFEPRRAELWQRRLGIDLGVGNGAVGQRRRRQFSGCRPAGRDESRQPDRAGGNRCRQQATRERSALAGRCMGTSFIARR